MKRMKKFMALACSALLALTGFGCAKINENDVQFWVYGDEDELEIYSLMTKEFNRTYGKEHGINVQISTKPTSSYTTLIQTTASSNSGPDVFFTVDNYFKQWVGMGLLSPLSEEYFAQAEDLSLSDIPDTAIERLRYDDTTGTSTDTSPLYGLPIDTKPTALYYNESIFEKAGITVISVDEEDMDKWNAGEIADRRGKYKKDYEKIKDINVPKKGFYRSESPYTNDEYAGWTKPNKSETMVFNNRIALNWDELEDIAMLFSPEYNTTATTDFGTDYGFFTEWWFSYGWSVGGDCLADLSGSGDWNLSLFDKSPNYVVLSEEGYTGEYTGTKYKKGETLELTDKLEIPKGVIADWEEDGSYSVDGEVVGVRSTVSQAKESGVLGELPSQLEAFIRYLRLGVNKATNLENTSGLQLSPNPNMFGVRSAINYFYSSKLAMLIESSAYIKTLSIEAATRNFKWDVAPLPVYKQYADPEDPDCDEVVVRGVEAGHSNSKGLVTRKKSTKGKEVAAFMLWMAGPDGQDVRAKNGHFPNQPELVSKMKFKEYAPSNIAVFGEGLGYQRPGDWWYLKSYTWIDIWANPLNSYIRNNEGKPTYSDWKKDSIIDTNEELKLNY
ncbi:MAG: extracellular solute-binding protein [Clostridia bacterium]|nr:extracellular solute-binding protein [Clostridia bacterium]